MSITINKKTTRFFISIAKKGRHSFIMLGLYEGTLVSRLLCRVGKLSEGRLCRRLLICFNSLNSSLRDEGFDRDYFDEELINYQAFDICYEQYCQFICLLEGLQTEDNQFNCFKPIREYEEHEHEIEMQETTHPAFLRIPVKEQLAKDIAQLSVGNTCRHTAIRLAEEVQRRPLHSFSSLVSRFFFKDMPYTTRLDHGRPWTGIPFYVLPTPPTLHPEQNLEQRTAKKTLEHLYWRMEKIALLEPQAQKTQEKFSCLKAMYNELFSEQEPLSIEALLDSIQQWKNKNQETLSAHRRLGFWKFLNPAKTATMSLVDAILDDVTQQTHDQISDDATGLR